MASRGAKRKRTPLAATPKMPPTNSDVASDAAPTGQQSEAERAGIIDRRFYPPEVSNERCHAYDRNEIARPFDALEATLSSTAAQRHNVLPRDAVVHWFKRDLRTHDNRPLSKACATARQHAVPLIGVFLVSPQDYEAHVTSSARVDFELRSLAVLRDDLATLDVPLYVETVQKRKALPARLLELCARWRASHVFCGMEYEVDELRRDEQLVRLALEQGLSFTVFHDDVVVPPGALKTTQGGQFSVYSPWYRAWTAHIHANPSVLLCASELTPNPASARLLYSEIFSATIPAAPPNKALPADDHARFARLWPAGEHEARLRLARFLADKAPAYKETRNQPAAHGTSMLSVHFSSGTLAARTAVRHARELDPAAARFAPDDAGPVAWVAELAWRDFYKHVLARWPHVCMHKPFKLAAAGLRWEYEPAGADGARFAAWRAGRTGVPLVDAAMRHLAATAHMPNRARMVVASFLAKDLLLDWRLGERYFMSALVDGDFASNSGGWGFGAGVGVDPQPYVRIFNPVLQSEKFDPDGEYIRRWVPELADVQGRAVHDPYARGAGEKAAAMGYPRPIVEHRASRQRALERYKEVM